MMQPRVLIADDEPSMRKLLETDLRLRSFEPHCCASANEALQLVKEQDFDVLLTDIRMPGLSGTELCERVVANR